MSVSIRRFPTLDASQQSLALAKQAEKEIDVLLKSDPAGDFALAYSRGEKKHVVYLHPKGGRRVIVGRFKLEPAWSEYFEGDTDHPVLQFGATVVDQYQKSGLATMVLTHYVKWLQGHANQSGRSVEMLASLLHLPTVLSLFGQLPPKERDLSEESSALIQYLNAQITNGTFKNLRDYGRTLERPEDVPAAMRLVKKAQTEVLARLIRYLDSQDWNSISATQRGAFLGAARETFFVRIITGAGRDIHWEIKSGHMKDKNRLLLSFRLSPQYSPPAASPV